MAVQDMSIIVENMKLVLLITWWQLDGETNMKMVDLKEQEAMVEFAKKAAKDFKAHPEHTTYTLADITCGCFFAMRWGMLDDGVLVFKVDENFEPVNFAGLIKQV